MSNTTATQRQKSRHKKKVRIINTMPEY